MILYHQYRPKPTHQQTVGQKIGYHKLESKAIFISAREWNQHDFVNTFETRQNIRKKRDDSPDTNTSKTLRYQNRSNFSTSSFNRMLKNYFRLAAHGEKVQIGQYYNYNTKEIVWAYPRLFDGTEVLCPGNNTRTSVILRDTFISKK